MSGDPESNPLRFRGNRVQPRDGAQQQQRPVHRLDKQKEKPGIWAGLIGLLDDWDDEGTRAQEDIIKELDDADEEARKTFVASLEAKEKAKGGDIDDYDVNEALVDLRRFQEAANKRLTPVGKFLRRQAVEFRAFIARGSVVDLAVGTVIGAAFTSIVKSFNAAFITPTLALITGGVAGVSELKFTMNEVEFPYGTFIASIIDFFISALILFYMVLKPYNYLKKTWDNLDVVHRLHGQKQKKKVEAKKAEIEKKVTKACPYCMSHVPILAVKCKFCTSDLPEDQSTGQTAQAAAKDGGNTAEVDPAKLAWE